MQFIIRTISWSSQMRTGLIKGALFALLTLSFCPSLGMAAPCIAPPLAPEAIAKFKSNPEALISPDTDTRSVEGMVRDLAGTDASLAVDLVRLARGAAPRFKTAIAAGLAQAAVSCGTINQEAALLIQQAVASLPDGDFQAAFAAVAGDLSTAATEAALASSASSVGSVVVVNPNSSQGSPRSFGGGGNMALVQITAGAAAITRVNGTAAGNTTTTAASPVSATR
jgi:hypothetical protein